jgi:hypothetical protein
MAVDQKKVIIKQSDLPPINSDTNSHVIRFRIVSDDGNRSSHWSPIYSVDPVAISKITAYSSSHTASSATVTWTIPVSLQDVKLDVYLRLSGQANADNTTAFPWTYAGTTSGTSFTANIPANITNLVTSGSVATKHYHFAVQLQNSPRMKEASGLSTTITLFEQLKQDF